MKFLYAALMMVPACSGEPKPSLITLDGTPRLVSFGAPVQSSGPTREICLVGARGDVGRLLPEGGATVRAILVTAEGYRDTLRAPSIERRGDEMVCLSDRAQPTRQAMAVPLTYLGVELTSSTPVQLREVRWWVETRSASP